MFFLFFFGERKFRFELHGNLRPETSLISTERVTYDLIMWGIICSHWVNLHKTSTPIPCPVDRGDTVPLSVLVFKNLFNPLGTADSYSRSLRDATGPADVYIRIPTSMQVMCIAT